ncbi:hypothetical protein H8F22_02590 [Pseudomonas sp. P154a]|uniref:putative phage abortive infection protein n=1 Tax=Pseudomonas mucoides TaxID=2730424 RepID=UPI0018921521|nr:putative phage abortive infection protein [Pseudomonas mucoides]MBF6037755.1 hypothetical protein [Pseudomonas mucoides]
MSRRTRKTIRLISRCISVNRLKIIIGTAIVLMAAVLINYFVSFPAIRSTDQAVWGQFGDYFGGVLNPLLSFCALIAVVLSLRSQSEEVAAARKEASAAIAMQTEQTQVFQQQSFESVFFGLIQLHLKNVDRVKAPVRAEDAGNGTTFELIIRSYNLDRVDDGIDQNIPRALGGTQYQQKQVSDYCNRFMEQYGNRIVHYFATLEEILKYVDSRSRPKSVGSSQYISIFKSLLSPEEVECLLMYAISDKGKSLRPFMAQHNLCALVPRRARIGLAEQILEY